MILLCCALSDLMDFKTRYSPHQVLQSWFGKKRGHRYFFFFKNYLLDFVFYFHCCLASRYRNINDLKRVLSLKLHFTQSRGFGFFVLIQTYLQATSLVERFFSTSDTRQCMVEKKLCGHARFVSHMSIISVRWTIIYRLVNIRASIIVLFFYSAAHTSSLKQTRSRKSRITFKSKEDWMFFYFVFLIVELQTSHIFPYWKASFSGIS